MSHHARNPKRPPRWKPPRLSDEPPVQGKPVCDALETFKELLAAAQAGRLTRCRELRARLAALTERPRPGERWPLESRRLLDL